MLSFVLDGVSDRGRRRRARPRGHRRALGPPLRAASLRRFGLEATVRPSLALYNTCEDIDALVDALRRLTAGRHPRTLG